MPSCGLEANLASYTVYEEAVRLPTGILRYIDLGGLAGTPALA